MLARRFALPSIQEPPYDPKVVPAAEKGLAGTVLCRPSREQWLAGLGELVQMCNEAMRRKKTSRDAKKPPLAPNAELCEAAHENSWTVVCVYVSPGRSIMFGK